MSLTRRKLLTRAGLGGMALVAASGCGPAPQGVRPEQAASGTALEWWQNSMATKDMHAQLFADNIDLIGGPVKITRFGNAQMGKSLQLAKQGGQLPDCHTLAGLETPLPLLVENDWLRPLEFTGQAKADLDKIELLDGIHVFDGKPYGFPMFSGMGTAAIMWFHKPMLEKAGLDPAAPPATYDDFRAACRKLHGANGSAAPVVLGMKEKGRLGPQMTSFAQSAGFEGDDGMLFRTGEYAYHDDAYLAVIELLRSLVVDKLMMPGAGQLSGAEARARWAGGAAAIQFDGTWVPGELHREYAQIESGVGYAMVMTANADQKSTTYSGAPGGVHYISSAAKEPEMANRAIGLLTSPDYQRKLAGVMPQPVRDTSVVQESDATDLYKQMSADLVSVSFRGPSPLVKNPSISTVKAKSKGVKPGLSEIVQALINGDLTDARKELKSLSDRSEADREQSIAAAKEAGATVDESDYRFANWQPQQNYTKQMYADA